MKIDEGAIVWLTGLPSSGKSTLASAVAERLRQDGVACCVLDGDAVRGALVPPPGYDDAARDHFYDTLGRLALLLSGQGLVVLVPATAHRREYRERVRAGAARFVEVWVRVPLEECRRRDAKGLYAAFARQSLKGVPGEDLVYEPPPHPEIVADGGADERALDALMALLAAR